jgi:hypothetical protein
MTPCSSLRLGELVPSVPHAWFVRAGLVLSVSHLPDAKQVAKPYQNFCLGLRPGRVLLINVIEQIW